MVRESANGQAEVRGRGPRARPVRQEPAADRPHQVSAAGGESVQERGREGQGRVCADEEGARLPSHAPQSCRARKEQACR